MRFVVELVGVVDVTGDEDGPLNAAAMIDAHLDAVMDELVNLGAADPAIELDMSCRQVTMAVMVEAANPFGATSQASGLIRTAIHTAHGATPDWPEPTDEAWSVRILSLRSDPVTEPTEAHEPIPA